MRKISSSMTIFYKRLLPYFLLIVFGAAVCGIGWALSHARPGARALPPYLAVFFLLPGIFVTVFLQRYLGGLVDEVYDEQDCLRIRNAGKEEVVLYTDIANINCITMVNPPKVTISVRSEMPDGPLREISFIPRLEPLRKRVSPEIQDLIRRVDAKRRSG